MRNTSNRQSRPRNPKSKADVRRARQTVRRWFGWFIPPAVLMPFLLLMQVDQKLIAVCMLAFPLVIIRTVEAWNEYQSAREETARLV